MVRVLQALLFVAAVSAAYLLGEPYPDGIGAFGVLLGSAVVVATVVYVVPWVFRHPGEWDAGPGGSNE